LATVHRRFAPVDAALRDPVSETCAGRRSAIHAYTACASYTVLRNARSSPLLLSLLLVETDNKMR
jgi:hypothetical protein